MGSCENLGSVTTVTDRGAARLWQAAFPLGAGAGGQPKDPIERAEFHSTCDERNEPDEQKPAIACLREEKKRSQEPNAEDKAKRAVESANIYLHRSHLMF